jgi:hypothetical protein
MAARSSELGGGSMVHILCAPADHDPGNLDYGRQAVIPVGIGLICFGIAALTYPSVTSMSKVVENAHQQSSIDNRETTSVSPLVGGLLLMGGVVLVAMGAKASPH